MKMTRLAMMATALLLGTSVMASSASADLIRVDLGGDSRVVQGFNADTGDYWNATTTREGPAITDLIRAADGASTGVGLSFTQAFGGVNLSGTWTPATGLNYPGGASSDSVFGNDDFALGQITLTGLDSSGNTTYDFTFFGSRDGVTDNRETQYSVVGGNGTFTSFLDVANNTSNVALVTDIIPDASGSIVIDVSKGPNNTNGSGYYYLGVVEIESTSNPIPEPATMTLLGLGSLAMLRRRRTAK